MFTLRLREGVNAVGIEGIDFKSAVGDDLMTSEEFEIVKAKALGEITR